QLLGIALANVPAQRLHPRPVRGRAAGLPAAADEHLEPARPRRPDELFAEPALADARLADHEVQAAAAGERAVESTDEDAELRIAADERAPRHLCDAGVRGRDEVERRILPQDRALELAQL